MTHTNLPTAAQHELAITPNLEQQRIPAGNALKISTQLNKHTYGFDDVMIIHHPQNTVTPFQLLVIQAGIVLKNQWYKKLRGARIAFYSQFIKRNHFKNIPSEWTHFYPPEPEWLAEKREKAEEQA